MMARADNDPYNVLRSCTSNGLASAAEILSGLSGTGGGRLTNASLLSGNTLVPNLTGIGGTSGLLPNSSLLSTGMNGNTSNRVLGSDMRSDDSSITAMSLSKEGATKESTGEKLGLNMLSVSNGNNGMSTPASKFISDSFGTNEIESTDKGEGLRAKGRHLLVDIHGLAVFLRQSTRCLACRESNCLYVTGAICAPLTAITQVTITCQQCKYRTSQPLARPRPQSPDRTTSTPPISSTQTTINKSKSVSIKIKEESKLKEAPQNNDFSNSKSPTSSRLLDEIWVKEEPKSPHSMSPNPDRVSYADGVTRLHENRSNSLKENTEVTNISNPLHHLDEWTLPQQSSSHKINACKDKLENCSSSKSLPPDNSEVPLKKRKRKNGHSPSSHCKRSTCHVPDFVSKRNSMCDFVSSYPHSQFLPPLFSFPCHANRYLDPCCSKELNPKKKKMSKSSKMKREKNALNEDNLHFDCDVDIQNKSQVSTTTTLENKNFKCPSRDLGYGCDKNLETKDDKTQDSEENTKQKFENHESQQKAGVTQHTIDMQDRTIKGKRHKCKRSGSPSYPQEGISENPCFDHSHKRAMQHLMNSAQLMSFGTCSCSCRAGYRYPYQRLNHKDRKSKSYFRQHNNLHNSIKRETEENDDSKTLENENILHDTHQGKTEKNIESKQKHSLETRKCNGSSRNHCCSEDGGPYGPSWRFHDLLSSESESDSEEGNLMIDTSSSDEDS